MADKNVAPEVVAAITAAVQSLVGNKVVAVRIRPSEAWKMTGRQAGLR